MVVIEVSSWFEGNHTWSPNSNTNTGWLYERLPNMNKPLVVQFKDISFRYRNNYDTNASGSGSYLIQNMSMNVRHGQVYALLGPNGCGKTTSLNLILGLIRPQKGQVLVFGKRPNSSDSPVPGVGSGYMPQDLMLIPTTTVRNNFYYFGRLHGLTDREIHQRSKRLLEILAIPEPSFLRQVSQLSGGQQRRASLAITLLHQPPLLILDEPTVGIDPLLREKVWQYLHEICAKQSKAVILTTHYIEESRHADTIGLMRNGRLLTEADPEALLRRFQMESIEQVFLKLCEKQDLAPSSINPESSIEKIQPSVEFFRFETETRIRYSFDIRRFTAMIPDIYALMAAQTITMLITLLLPSIQVILFHLAIGLPPKTLPISVVMPETENQTNRFGPTILSHLDPTVDIRPAPNVGHGLELIDRQEVSAVFDFPANFTRCLMHRVRYGYQSRDSSLNCSTVRGYLDNTVHFITFQLVLYLRDAYDRACEVFLPRRGYHPQLIATPFETEYVYGNNSTYQEMMAPGLYMSYAFLAPMMTSLLVFVEHKCQRHIFRSQACGAKPAEILAAHFVASFLMLLAQCTMMILISAYVFEAKNLGSALSLWFITLMVGVSGICWSLFIGSVLNNKSACFMVVYGFITVMWLACGIIWPVESNQWPWLQKAIQVLPLTMPSETARNIMNHGWEWDNPLVWTGLAAAVAHSLGPLILAWLMFKM